MRQYRNDGSWVLAGSPMREPAGPRKRARLAGTDAAPLPASARMLQLQPPTGGDLSGPAAVPLPPLLQPGDDDELGPSNGDDLDDLDDLDDTL